MNPRYKCTKSIPGVAISGKVYEATNFDALVTLKNGSSVSQVTTLQLNECFAYVSGLNANQKRGRNDNSINS